MARQVELEVPAGLDGERLDKVVASLLDLSRSQASLVARAGVTVDGVDAGASDRVAAGAVIRCVPPEESPALEPEPVEFEVLYEDEAMLVVDKPAGVVVHPGAGQARGTLAAGLLHRFPELEGVGDAGRWGLVHRLDRETSGAIVVGRTEQAFALLRAQLAEREMRRIYTTIVEGRMEAATGTVDAPIARDPAHPTRRAVVAGGKPARTYYEVIRHFEKVDHSLLSVSLETGRTHQIRVHMSAIGHPVAGDRSYGATRLTVPRICLHAASVELDHPLTGKRLKVVAPLPPDLDVVLRGLS